MGFANYTDKTDDYWGGGIGLTYFLPATSGSGQHHLDGFRRLVLR